MLSKPGLLESYCSRLCSRSTATEIAGSLGDVSISFSLVETTRRVLLSEACLVYLVPRYIAIVGQFPGHGQNEVI
jgi:hypothetical protein